MIANGTNAAEELVETTRGSYRTAMSWAGVLQEPYTKLVWGLLEQTRKQQEAFQALLNEGPELPIEDYDRLTVKEVIGRLDGFSPGEVERLKTYEKNNKNRVTLVKRFDRGSV